MKERYYVHSLSFSKSPFCKMIRRLFVLVEERSDTIYKSYTNEYIILYSIFLRLTSMILRGGKEKIHVITADMMTFTTILQIV